MSEEQKALDQFSQNIGESASEKQDTSLGRLPADWDVRSIGNDFKIEYGKEKHEKELQVDGHPVYGANGVIGYGDEYLFEEPVVTITCRGATCGNINLTEPKSWVTNNSLALLRSKGVNKRFLADALRHHSVERAISGSAQPQITATMLAKMDYPVPSLPEQRKIATVLYTVDRAIEKTEELVNQTERVKTGLTQDLLSRGINNQQMVETDSRFGLLPEAWELRPLKEVCEIAGRTAPEKDDTECWGGDIPWATPSEITSLVGQTIDDTEEHLTELALEKVSSNLLPPMSVLMTTRATIGECAVNTVEMTTNQGFKNVIPGEALDTWYAYYRLDYERDYLASLSKGSTFPEVGKDTVENFVIPVPPIEEQREIGELLQSVDEQILSYKESKSQYKRLKRGLMQDLLSGTVRTTDTNIQVPEKITQYG